MIETSKIFLKKLLLILAPVLLLLLFLFSFSVSSEFFQKGFWFAKNKPIATDVSTIYLASQIIKNGQGQKIYDYEFQGRKLNELHEKYSKDNIQIPEKFTDVDNDLKHFYYYPPNSLVIPWLTQNLSPPQICLVINIISFLLLAICLFLALKENIKRRITFVFLASILLFQPFLHSVFHSQLSLFVACCFYLYFYFSQKKKKLLAGFFLSLTLFKPQLGIALLLIPLLTRDFKALLWTLLSTSFFLLFSFTIIGLEGYEMYFKLIIQSLGLNNFGLFSPIPIEPAYPIDDLLTAVLPINGLFGLSLKNLILVVNILFSLSIAGLMIYLAMKYKEYKQSGLLITVLALCSLLIFKYHQSHDYCLWIAVSLIAISNNQKVFNKSILWFVLVCSFLPFALTSTIGSKVLVLNYHIHIYWIVTLLTILFLLLKINSLQKEQ